MPIYQGYGPFDMMVNSRRFNYYFCEDGPFGKISQVESEDRRIVVKVNDGVLSVWGSEFPGTSKRHPRVLTFEPKHLAVRSPGDYAQAIIGYVLAVLMEDNCDD